MSRIQNSIFVNDFKAIPDGVTDNTNAIQGAINKCFALGGGYVDFGVGNYAVSSTILMKSGVFLRGQGCGFDWSPLNANLTRLTPTVISWLGSAAGIVVQFPSGAAPNTTVDAGLVDICIDGKEVAPSSGGITGVQILSCINIKLRRTFVYRCSFGLSVGESVPHFLASAQHTLEDFYVETCYDGITFKGADREYGISAITKANPAVVTATGSNLTNGETCYINGVGGMTQVNNLRFIVANATANTFQLNGIDSTGYSNYTAGGTVIQQGDGGGTDCFGERIYIINYQHYGFSFRKWCDTNGFDSVRLLTFNPATGVTGIIINSEPGLSAFPMGASGISFKNTLIEQVAAPGACIIVNNNDGIDGSAGAFTFTGWYVGDPPVVQNGGLANIDNQYYAKRAVSQVSVWTGGEVTFPDSAVFAIINNGAYGMFTASNLVKGGAVGSGNTQWGFWPVKINWITFWNPASATGAIRLHDESAGVIQTVTPGAAGFLKSTVDITAYCKANFTSGLNTVYLEAAGDGVGNRVVILKSILEITVGS